MFPLILSSLVIDAIFFTYIFHSLAGSIRTVTQTMGRCFNASHTFFARFAAIWPLISSNLGIDVFLLEIFHFGCNFPCSSRMFNDRYSGTRTRKSAKVWSWISLTFQTPFMMLFGILTVRNCLVHLNQSWFKGCETSPFQLLVSPQASQVLRSWRNYAQRVINFPEVIYNLTTFPRWFIIMVELSGPKH